jgi:hypothetical protein
MDDLHRERRSGQRARWPGLSKGALGVGPVAAEEAVSIV